MINNPILSSIDAKMRVNGGFFIFSSFLSRFLGILIFFMYFCGKIALIILIAEFILPIRIV